MDPRTAEPQAEDPDFLPLEKELENVDLEAAAEMTLLLDRVRAARLSGA